MLYSKEKEVLLILLSEIDPCMLELGDLSRDLAVLPGPLPRYHSRIPLLRHILEHIMPYQHLQSFSLLHLYSHGDTVVYLLYTTSL